MPYAILLVSKLASVGAATTATEHNYRTQDTPNADPQLADANVEYVNHERRSYWHLATERIQELHLPRLREDAVRAVELVLTASPDGFPRDADHRAKDVRDSPWLRDNLTFVHQRFGKENVVGFMLHQDEITPHIHCVVVPVTTDGRLSCRDVFSPASLRQLQTDYAKAMEPHGLMRGIHYSTAHHEDVRRYYGAQQMSKEALAELAQPLTLPTHWLAAKHEKMTDEQYRRQAQSGFTFVLTVLRDKANKKIEELATVATANALAHERAKVLERQLANSQRLLVTTRTQHATTTAELTQQLQQARQLTEQHRTQAQALQASYQRAVVRHSQGDPIPERQQVELAQARERHRQTIEQVLAQRLPGPVREIRDFNEALGAAGTGYRVHVTEARKLEIVHKADGMRLLEAELMPNGQPFKEQYVAARQRTLQLDRPAPSTGELER